MRNALAKIGSVARRAGRNRLTAALLGGALVLMIGGGTAVAADHIGSEDIRDGSILRKDLHPDHVMADINQVWWGELAGRIRPDINNVFSSEIVNGTIQSEDISDDAKSELRGVNRYEVIGRGTDSVTLAPEESAEIVTLCASDNSSPEQQAEVALGGGAKAKSGSITMGGSYPSDIEQVSEADSDDPAGRWKAGGWAVHVTAGPDGATVQPYVTCAAMN
ncbi:hypothetical protein [Haloechinothrix salitolerans]|uniref:Uncharacterized protein n=1 Tax=Haloechinothrix salitolerans TaxID=926830 RepID=A0ABW2C6N1_9PSEU